MPVVVTAFVKNGLVVPNAPLPRGAFAETHDKGEAWPGYHFLTCPPPAP